MMGKKFTPEDLARLKSVAFNQSGLSGDRVRNYRRDDGQWAKATTDELNNTVTQHGESQDVMIRPKTMKVHAPLMTEG